MASQQKDTFYRNLSTILLSVIAIFGVSSVILLLSINSKLNAITVEQAIQKEQLKTLKEKVSNLELVYDGTKDKKHNSKTN